MENRKNKKKYWCFIKWIRESWHIQKHLPKNEKCQQTKTNKFYEELKLAIKSSNAIGENEVHLVEK